MTRFARAKGSKASNERVPNEATPWYLMKQQLEENKNRDVAEVKKSAKELLKDEKDMFYNDTVTNHDWAEFNNNAPKSNINKIKISEENGMTLTVNSEDNDARCITAFKKNCTKSSQDAKDTKIEEASMKSEFSKEKEKHKLNDSYSQSNKKESNILENNVSSEFVKLSKRQKRNQKRKLNQDKIQESKSYKRDLSDKSSYNDVKESKITEKGEYKRRKQDIGITKVMIDGVETIIVKYDGFPVKKEDADRLAELKQKMIMKGVPKIEVDLAIKMERRKAEKALARAKKQVCFNCRVSGHKLSDCPEFDKEGAGTDICFKCGSTEHTHFECKVNKDSTYRYAKCFICSEQGHISKQCPDNPKGIYPHGGGCKICGAVTHLKKDCPDLIKSSEENAVTVEKMDDFTIESLQTDIKKEDKGNKQLKNKIIKF